MNRLGFFKKELRQLVKTPRYIVLFGIFLFFGILSPVTGRYLNEIIASLSNLSMQFPEPTFVDSWTQVFKNINTLVIIIYLIMMSGAVVSEKTKGSILLVLTKRVSRFNFLLSKFGAGFLAFLISFVISFFVSLGYTQYLFKEFIFDGIWMALLLSILLGIFYTVFGLFVSVISKTSTSAALLAFAGFAFLNIFNVIKGFEKFNPVGATAIINNMLAGQYSFTDAMINGIVTITFSIILFFISFQIFKKQEL